MRPLIPLALLLIAGGLGFFLYGRLNEEQATDELPLTDSAERPGTPDPEAKHDGSSKAPGADPAADAPATRNAPAVPRVLPPDAALEDVRDAYAHADIAELQQTYDRIYRLGSTNSAFAKAMHRLALHESDRRVAALIRQALETPWRKLTVEQRRALSTK